MGLHWQPAAQCVHHYNFNACDSVIRWVSKDNETIYENYFAKL